MCFQKYLGDTCECQSFLEPIPYYSEMRSCINASDIECVYHAWQEYARSKEVLESCECPLECERTYYSLRFQVRNKTPLICKTTNI